MSYIRQGELLFWQPVGEPKSESAVGMFGRDNLSHILQMNARAREEFLRRLGSLNSTKKPYVQFRVDSSSLLTIIELPFARVPYPRGADNE